MSIQSGAAIVRSTPWVGLIPTRPQNAAGIRIEPPPSVAVAIGTMPEATAAALPPLDPPGEYSRRHGLPVVPKTRFSVYPSVANSGRFVLPTITAPASDESPGHRAVPGRRRRVDEQQRSLRGDHALDVFEVLDQHGNPGERARVSPSGHGGVHRGRCSLGLLVAPGDHGVEGAVVLVDPTLCLGHQLSMR